MHPTCDAVNTQKEGRIIGQLVRMPCMCHVGVVGAQQSAARQKSDLGSELGRGKTSTPTSALLDLRKRSPPNGTDTRINY